MPSSSLKNPCSVRYNQHVPISKSSWFLNQMGTFDCYYSLVGVLIPENQALWWQSTYNALYLEDTYQDAAQHLSPFPNTLIAPGFGASRVTNFTQILKVCPVLLCCVPLVREKFYPHLAKPFCHPAWTQSWCLPHMQEYSLLTSSPFWPGTCSLG